MTPERLKELLQYYRGSTLGEWKFRQLIEERIVAALKPDTHPATPSSDAQDAALTDDQIDVATQQARDQLLDHIDEYGTGSEGILRFVRAIARAAMSKGGGA